MNKKNAQSFFTIFSQHRFFFSIFLFLIFITSVYFSLLYALSGAGRKSFTSLILPNSESATSTHITTSTQPLQSFAVMIDAHTDAQPTCGLAKANIVFTIPVEGGLTRYMAIYDASSTVEKIGPIRSARQYFVELADSLHVVYAHVGGSPEALDTIKNTVAFRDLNEMYNGYYFWRDGNRAAPHNTFTSMNNLNEAFVSKKMERIPLTLWQIKDDATTTGAIPGPSLSNSNAGYDVVWKYDHDTNTYTRFLHGKKQHDEDGSYIVSKNVLILHMSMKDIPNDDKQRISVITIGRGKGILYHDGNMSEIIWHRKPKENFTFETVDGADAFFNRGTTWIEVIASTTTKL